MKKWYLCELNFNNGIWNPHEVEVEAEGFSQAVNEAFRSGIEADSFDATDFEAVKVTRIEDGEVHWFHTRIVCPQPYLEVRWNRELSEEERKRRLRIPTGRNPA